MKYTKIPADTFKQIQMNAGVLAKTFNPKTAEIGELLGATTGGNSFTATPTFEDFGSDIDNCPKNTKELKKLTEWEVKDSGTFVTLTSALAEMLVGAGDASVDEGVSKITPRSDLLADDFEDIWLIGDYSDDNSEESGGFVAIHMMNVLNTSGFSIKTSDKAKGQFAFEFTAHYSLSNQTVVPFEIYVKSNEG